MKSMFETSTLELQRLIDNAVSKSSEEAAKMPTTKVSGDRPIKVKCYGTVKEWKSMYLAYHFYLAGATMCEGSESDRYWLIVARLIEAEKNNGIEVVTDQEY